MCSTDAVWDKLQDGLPTIAGKPHVAVRIHRSFVTQVAANSHKSPTISRLLTTGLQTHLAKQTATLVETGAVPATNEPTWSITSDWLSLDLQPADLSHLASAQ
jgi:hypothetical protein